MKVILTKTQEVKDVADGYARNYLIPSGLAVAATPEKLQEVEREKVFHDAAAQQRIMTWEERINDFTAHPLVVHAAANEDGTLFGAVSKSAILQALAARGVRVGTDIREDWLEIATPIKTTGAHTLLVHVPQATPRTLSLTVERS